MATAQWRVRLAAEAELDIADILRWTTERFGPGQAATYRKALNAALTLLSAEHGVVSASKRDDIAPGVWSLHLRVVQPRARHFILYRMRDDDRQVVVLRVLHDSRDLRRHLRSDR